jgi:hypothetical protein
MLTQQEVEKKLLMVTSFDGRTQHCCGDHQHLGDGDSRRRM